MHKDENGYIVVETVGTFVPFIFLVISILSLVNIVTMQARVHYALTQAACTLSMYSYVLKVTDLSDGLVAMDSKASVAEGSINSVLDAINSLSKGHPSIIDDGNRVLGEIETAVADPKTTIQNFANLGLSRLQSKAVGALVQPFIGRYLVNGDMSSDDYFKFARVVNFEFGNCILVDKNENVKLTVSYEIEYTFGALSLPMNPTLKVTQTVVTKAWLGGSGEGYW
ncbi:MAG: hypothetical protein LBD23_16855 [Oscillospiraceae bacterium]|jgi:hypothetical protein|nr:hypothetical protein [Oscillospiraceae bacterium]